MKRFLLTTTLVLFSACAAPYAQAQPIESEPLAPLEIKPITAQPLDNVPQEDTPDSPSASSGQFPPVQQPTSGVAPYPTSNTTKPIAPIVPYGGSMGTAPNDKPVTETKICAMQVSFESACCGTDVKTGEILKTYLDANKDKLTYTKSNWGREGEYTYCIDVPDHKNRGRTYSALKKIIEDTPAKYKPVSLSGTGFTPVNNAKAFDAR